eukprot:scaffold298221_cov28-Tisochrysis_lutea.AAC.1
MVIERFSPGPHAAPLCLSTKGGGGVRAMGWTWGAINHCNKPRGERNSCAAAISKAWQGGAVGSSPKPNAKE